ncbi:MAG: hypothetical protein K2X43_20730 [Hyphomonadaceae bacterium]|jgi:hypothetical protein|nr:hypothetical protein [Hyphomonadaceae bacterium]
MKASLRLFAVAMAAIVLAAIAHARVQPQPYCWSPDAEFPVACDPDEDDGG